jgi:uncharacterized phage protein (TIGR01671 family)
MRDYIFRGKRIDNGEWVQGDLIHERYGTVIQYITLKYPTGNGAPEREPISERHKVTVDPSTVGQATGLKDKNGKMIFEGDVVHCYGGEHCQGYWEHDDKITINSMINDCFMMDTSEFIKVIGNIHDNPELIP